MSQTFCEKIHEITAVDTVAVMKFAFSINRQFGFVRAKDDTPYTPSSLKRLMHAISEYAMQDDKSQYMMIDLHDNELPGRIKKTIEITTSENLDEKQKSYLQSVLSVLSRETIPLNDVNSFAVIASLPEAYKKINKPPVENLAYTQPFGEIRQRGQLKLKLISEPVLDQSKTFPVVKFFFEDDDGHYFAWHASESSAPKLLSVGKHYTLTGTIDHHYENVKKRKVTTYLSRCCDFIEVSADSQIPDFKQTANSRDVPDSNSVVFSIKNEIGGVDGKLYIIINRRWSEKGQIRTLKNIHIELQDWVAHPEQLQELIAKWVSSQELERDACKVFKNDKRLFSDIQNRARLLFTPRSLLSSHLFFVDDAQYPANKPFKVTDLYAERKKRRLFFSLADAESFALANDKQISLISEFDATAMRCFFYPSEMQTADGFDLFMESISTELYDAIVGVKSDGTVSKIYPLILPGSQWNYLNTISITSQVVRHSQRSHMDANELHRYSFLVVTGFKPELYGDLQATDESNTAIWHKEFLEISHRLNMIDYGCAVCTFRDIYQHLQSETIENQRGMVHIVYSHPIDCFLLQLMGANVFSVHLELNSEDNIHLYTPDRTIHLSDDGGVKGWAQIYDELKRASLDALSVLN